jgi:hypothetical protein
LTLLFAQLHLCYQLRQRQLRLYFRYMANCNRFVVATMYYCMERTIAAQMSKLLFEA